MEIKINLPNELVEQIKPFLKEDDPDFAASELVQVALREYLSLRAPLSVEFAENSPEDVEENATQQETKTSTPFADGYRLKDFLADYPSITYEHAIRMLEQTPRYIQAGLRHLANEKSPRH